MFKKNENIIEQLETILNALRRIPRRFAGIKTATDFSQSEEGIDKLDAICMILIAAGEAFKRLDQKTEGQLLIHYPQVDWKGVKGVRDVIAHGYFDVDSEQLFNLCRDDIPILIQTVQQMIIDITKLSDS
ncbi:HepT-like ribonuclease domain-containing protein [Thioflexithrix psekupsensis]|uniref:Antitoxin n=1 Tax=Thioflexithrix psekupsensis TaxID=1570016 RepID=A0A251X9K8_9GAMM|nr:HepT-like ribonuclease domain-containing protein [Thioflexithrix psekupsensis]OUD14484.1 hypothetical protein TPSD3_09285 [Thioflexithrix psekupsensis]